MLKPIKKIYLENGLQIMLKEIHTAPIISHWLWYRVGSRDEIPGKTGVSHWVEHMQFKGTPKFPSDEIEAAISRTGGIRNALTYVDWTTYYETMPADKIDLALQFEADRMVNSSFDPDEVKSERTVIMSERQGRENSPGFLLGEAVRAAAFRVHSYHHEIVGDMVDLEAMTRDDLYNHYRSYYRPNNAILTIAGDFETEVMLERVRELHDVNLGSDTPPPRVNRPEPAPRGEHRLTVEGPGETTMVEVVYHTPTATNPDFFALLVLDSLLTGPSGLNLFGGGGISNKTSRLYTAMIEEKNVAIDVMGGLPATIDPFLQSIHFIVHPQKTVAEALAVVDGEIQRLQDTPPTQQEIDRAVKQARALFAYGGESITNQAFWMGFAEIFASYEWVVKYVDSLAGVTPADVQRVAQTYLQPKNRVIGTYLPKNEKTTI
ncbi:MAG: pitrilysin family protein [Chloroflexota bacterium]|nr:pitrilysin family protein [Chloroflexota bacterium]